MSVETYEPPYDETVPLEENIALAMVHRLDSGLARFESVAVSPRLLYQLARRMSAAPRPFDAGPPIQYEPWIRLATPGGVVRVFADPTAERPRYLDSPPDIVDHLVREWRGLDGETLERLSCRLAELAAEKLR